MDKPHVVMDTASNRWFVAYASEWWTVISPIDAAILCGFFILKTTSGSDEVSTATAGFLEIANTDDHSVEVVFKKHDGEAREASFEVSRISTGTVHWTDGRFDDGWLTTRPTLQYSNANTIGFRFYLPDSRVLDEKHLDIEINNRIAHQVALARNALTEVTVEIPPHERSQGQIRLLSAYRELSANGQDQRDLGAVCISLNVDETEWDERGGLS